MTTKLYSLFIDDERIPERGYESDVPDGVALQYSKLEYSGDHNWIICRSSFEAIEYVKKYGPPTFISFDHDLGGNDTSREFLKWWGYEWNEAVRFPDFVVHSENVVGRVWITDFINSFNSVFDG